jgi:hypothetical protein
VPFLDQKRGMGARMRAIEWRDLISSASQRYRMRRPLWRVAAVEAERHASGSA